MKFLFSGISALNTSLSNSLILLRWCTITIQLALVLFVNVSLQYELPWMPLLLVIVLESMFNLGCYLYNRNHSGDNPNYIFTQLLADILFLGALLYLSGGATNAFVSLLLIPIAIAAVTLKKRLLLMVTASAIAIYSVLLWLMPMHVMHGNMQGHFIGMWINFIFSAIVVTLFIAKMTQLLRDKDKTIAHFREQQLKQEKVMALGVASAQVTHDLATPLANIRLLIDELLEESDAKDMAVSTTKNNEDEILEELDKQVDRCCDNLHMFREMSLKIREDDKQVIKLSTLVEQIHAHCNFYYPNQEIDYQQDEATSKHAIISNSSLLPAILNVVNNAINASNKQQKNVIAIASCIENNRWQLTIRDFGDGFLVSQFSQVGQQQSISDDGLGMGLLLSNSSFERLHGQLQLSNHQQGGAQVMITLPLAKIGES